MVGTLTGAAGSTPLFWSLLVGFQKRGVQWRDRRNEEMKRILLLVGALAIVASACGAAGNSADGVASLDDSALAETTDTLGAAVMTDEEALFAFAACLRDLGLDIEDPTVDAAGNLRLRPPTRSEDGPPIDRATVQAECGHLLEGVSLGFRNQDRTEIEDQLLAFAGCMRDNGYDMPDPDFNATGQGGGPFGPIDRRDPEFQAAAEQCGDILAGFGPGGRGAGGRGQGNG